MPRYSDNTHRRHGGARVIRTRIERLAQYFSGKRLVMIGVASFLTACASIYDSERARNDGGTVDGLVYFVPTSLLKITMGPGENDGDGLSITLENVTVPDHSKAYELKYRPSAFANDDIFLATDAKGLLTTANTTAEDATGDVILALAKSATGLVTFGVPPSSRREKSARPGRRPLCKMPSSRWTIVIDPLDRQTWPYWLDDACIQVDPVGDGPPTDLGVSAGAHGKPEKATCDSGICYRIAYPYRVTATFSPEMYEQVTFGFLGASPVFSYDVTRAPFIRKSVSLTFDEGVLTEVGVNKPSVALAVAELPLNLTKAILSAPAEILKLRLDYNSTKEAEIRSRKQLREERERYREYLRDNAEAAEEGN